MEDNRFLSPEDSVIFEEYVSLRELKKPTVKSYLYILSSFLTECGCSLTGAEDKDAGKYVRLMREKARKGELSSYTVNMRIRVLSNIYSYLAETGYVPVSPFEGIRADNLDVRPLTINVPMASDLDAVLTAAAKFGEDAYLAFCLAVRMGLTSNELTEMRTDDVSEFEGKAVIRINGSSSRERLMVVPEDLTEKVLACRALSSCGYMFPSNRNGKYSLKGFQRRNEKIMEAAGLKGKFSMKDLRTRAILQMLHDGADASSVSRYADIQMQRIRSYQQAPLMESLALSSCPADLSHLKISDV